LRDPKFFIGDRVQRTGRLRSRTVVKIARDNELFWYQLLAPGDRRETCWEHELRRNSRAG
jgi:hypothetical protein